MSGGPATRVLAAFAAGATSLAEVGERADLDADAVRAVVDQLVRMGRLEASTLQAGCPSAGCGSCASGSADGAAGCGSPAPSARREGPVLVQLRVRR